MSCEGVRHQLHEFSERFSEDNHTHQEAQHIEALVRSACDQGSHTAHLLYQRRIAIRDTYVGQAKEFLAKHGVETTT